MLAKKKKRASDCSEHSVCDSFFYFKTELMSTCDGFLYMVICSEHSVHFSIVLVVATPSHDSSRAGMLRVFFHYTERQSKVSCLHVGHLPLSSNTSLWLFHLLLFLPALFLTNFFQELQTSSNLVVSSCF